MAKAEDLDRIVENHSPLLSGDAIVRIVQAIPLEFYSDPRLRLLYAIVAYHLEHKKDKADQDWHAVYVTFKDLPSILDPLSEFYRHNYLFLAGRNANNNNEICGSHFVNATSAAQRISEPLRDQIFGFLFFNVARWLLKIDKATEALVKWQQAAAARERWYIHVCTAGESDEVVNGAATQVWKMRKDFQNFFPDTDIEKCGVDEALFREVAKLADSKFSAKP